jgi:hypothetical protein
MQAPPLVGQSTVGPKRERAVLPWAITVVALGLCAWIILDADSREKLVARLHAWGEPPPPAPAASQAPPERPVVLVVTSWQPSSRNESWGVSPVSMATLTSTSSSPAAPVPTSATPAATQTAAPTPSTKAAAAQRPPRPSPRARPTGGTRNAARPTGASDGEDSAAAAAAKAVKSELEDTLDR